MTDGRLVYREGKLWATWTRQRDDKQRVLVAPVTCFADDEDRRTALFNPGELGGRAVTFTVDQQSLVDLRVVRPAQRNRPASRTQRDRPAGPGFRNPYNFVPAPPRNLSPDNPLSDHPPISHGRYAEDCWSGVLHVEMEVKTPLLLRRHVETKQVVGGDHNIYDVRRTGPKGGPEIHPSGLKGMLGAAFEAATNSRLRIFDHDKPLTRRLQQSETLELKPVRITAGPKEGDLLITEMKRVRLPYYPDPVLYAGKGRPKHGDKVAFDAYKVDGPAGDKVTAIRLLTTTQPTGSCEGWVVVTGKPDAATKKHEAIFVATQIGVEVKSKRAEVLAAGWRAVIDAYLAAGGIATVGAPHLNSGYGDLSCVVKRAEGLLCWAHASDGLASIDWLTPTRFGRATYPQTPLEALHKSLRPAASLDELSPADRVFGWTAGRATKDPQAAHRGQLRIDSIMLTSDPTTAICQLPDGGVTIAALSSPKPSQVLFYAAADEFGTAFDDRTSNKIPVAFSQAFRERASIRGRKVYPSRSAWRNSTAAQWRAPGGTQTTQNSTVLRWINPGATFTFAIRVLNLNAAELGGLVWLLSQGDGYHHRLGGGRPLGFGEVKLKCDAVRVRCGKDLAAALSDPTAKSAAPSASPVQKDVQTKFIDPFLAAARELSFAELGDDELPDHLAALAASLRVPPLESSPVHYPRLQTDANDAEAKVYEWFSANVQRANRRDPGAYALPGLLEELDLPYDPTVV